MIVGFFKKFIGTKENPRFAVWLSMFIIGIVSLGVMITGIIFDQLHLFTSELASSLIITGLVVGLIVGFFAIRNAEKTVQKVLVYIVLLLPFIVMLVILIILVIFVAIAKAISRKKVVFTCPDCRQTLTMTKGASKEDVVCPNCGITMTVG